MKTIFTDKAIELLNKQKGLWYRASEWLILKNFDVLNPIRYELLSDNRESHRNIVKNILMLENSQYHTYCVANSVLGGSFELALIDNAMELNSEIILNLIPLAHLKQPTIIENTEAYNK